MSTDSYNYYNTFPSCDEASIWRKLNIVESEVDTYTTLDIYVTGQLGHFLDVVFNKKDWSFCFAGIF